MNYIDPNALDQTTIQQSPFPHCVIKNFIKADKLQTVCDSFPHLIDGGIFNCNDENTQGPLAELIQELQQPTMRNWMANHFGVDLDNKPVMTTLRGYSREKDGRIHTDSKDKIVTVLIYLNPNWEAKGGKLRLLRSNNIDDYANEVTPEAGTCIIFKVTDNCWHGYLPYIGPRRQIMFNFLVSEQALKRHRSNHGLSAFMKKLKSKFNKAFSASSLQ